MFRFKREPNEEYTHFFSLSSSNSFSLSLSVHILLFYTARHHTPTPNKKTPIPI